MPIFPAQSVFIRRSCFAPAKETQFRAWVGAFQHNASMMNAKQNMERLIIGLLLSCLCGTAFAAPIHAAPQPMQEMNGLVFGLLAGTMLMACSYLFCIWLVFRDVSQLLLMIMLLLLTTHMIFSHDFIMQYFNLTSLWWQDNIRNLAMFGFLIVCVIFTINFLDLESHLPTLRYAMFAFMIAQAIGLLLANIFLHDNLALALPFIGPLNMAMMLLIGVMGLTQGISGSLTHMLAFFVFLAGSIAPPLHSLGLITIPLVVVDNMLYAAASVAAVIFAAVIAQQFTVQQELKERALQQSNERFSLAAQGANEGLYDWDLQHGRIYFSDRLKRIIGRNLPNTPQGLREFWRLIEPGDRNRIFQTFRQFRRSDKKAMSGELRVNRSNGTTVWLFATVVAIRDKRKQKITRMVGSLGDITGKKQSENATRLSEARFRSITEAHPVPVLIVKLNNAAIMYASPGTEPLVQMPQSALIGSGLSRLLGTAAQEFLNSIATARRIDMEEANLYHYDGSTIPVAVSGRLIDYQGEAAAVIGIYDLTDRKRAEAQIATQKEALQQSEKMAALGGLLAGVAHELNNPLSVIVGQATLLKETAQDKKVSERGDKIFTAAERCSRIVKSFLAIARRKPPEHKLMQLNDAVEQALELLTYPLRTENVQLKLELDENLPQIIGDQDQFVQVISNLVLNGAQAMKDWPRTRQITIRNYIDYDTGQVCLCVADTGPGIPLEIRTRVFEPFFTTKAPGSGTGVGLSLCLNIVTAHGGQLTVRDTPGGGASFFIHLPIPSQKQLPASQGKSIALPEATIKPMKILLVDDEFELAQTLADLLTPQGHSFDFAINGKIALEKLKAQRFDFILSDLRMPEMDGPTLFRHICADLPQYRDRIVFITGDTLTTFVHDFLKDNPVRFIEKPYTLSDIIRAIAEQLQVIDGVVPTPVQAG